MSNLAVVNGSAISNSAPSSSLSIQTVDDLGRIAKMMAASGFFADCKDAAQAGVKIMAGLELGFPAFASLVGIQIIKGKPVMGANLQAAAIKRSGKYNYRVKEHTPVNCSIEFLERFDGKWESCGTSDFSMDDAKAAGLNGGDNWRKYPKNMLFARAVSNGVRWYCPDLFLGAPVYTPDEFGIPVNEEGEAIGVISEVVPTPALKAVKVKGSSNKDRLAAIVTPLGLEAALSKAIRHNLLGKNKSIESYTADEIGKLQDALLIEWARQFPCWEHAQHRVNAYHKFVEGLDGVPTDDELLILWKEECDSRVEEVEAAKTKGQVDGENIDLGTDTNAIPF
jgi:hypothetical protein